MSDSVPNGWSKVEFDNFTTLQRGKDLTKAEFREGTVPVAGSNGVIGYHDTAIAKAPGITVGRSGSAGRVTVYEEDFWPHNTSLYVRDFHGNDPYFAGFLLGSLNLARFKTGASVPTLDRNSFKTLPLLVPPLPEQKEIAHILSTVQRAIEAQERIIQTTTELKKALMHKLFTEGLRHEPQKQTEIGPVPESWEVCKVPVALQKTRVGRQHQIPAKDIAAIGAHPVVDQGQAFVAGFTDDHARLIDFDLPLVIFGDHTRCFKFVDFPFVLGADGTKILKSNAKLFDPKFFFHALVALDLPSRGYNRHFKLLKEKSIPRPPLPEQRDIASAIDTVDQKGRNAETKVAALQDLFRTLLHELMTAKTRVHNAAFEV